MAFMNASHVALVFSALAGQWLLLFFEKSNQKLSAAPFAFKVCTKAWLVVAANAKAEF
jgi:hypothetical protein